MRAVLDTSAIAKWFLREEESSECKQLRDAFLKGEVELITCGFALVELSNVLRYAKGLSPRDVVDALEAVKAIGIELFDEHTLLEKAVELAFVQGITVYDSLFISLAMEIGAKLVTYDRVLLEKFPKLAVVASQLLREL